MRLMKKIPWVPGQEDELLRVLIIENMFADFGINLLNLPRIITVSFKGLLALRREARRRIHWPRLRISTEKQMRRMEISTRQ